MTVVPSILVTAQNSTLAQSKTSNLDRKLCAYFHLELQAPKRFHESQRGVPTNTDGLAVVSRKGQNFALRLAFDGTLCLQPLSVLRTHEKSYIALHSSQKRL